MECSCRRKRLIMQERHVEDGVKVLVGLNNTQIIKEKVKARKAAGLDGCGFGCLKSCPTSVVEWLVRLSNVYFVTSMVPFDRTSACILFKGKDDKYE